MSDYRTDIVGGPAGWSWHAIKHGWNTIAGVRKLFGELRDEKARAAKLEDTVSYLIAEYSDKGMYAELCRLRKENARHRRHELRMLVSHAPYFPKGRAGLWRDYLSFVAGNIDYYKDDPEDVFAFSREKI